MEYVLNIGGNAKIQNGTINCVDAGIAVSNGNVEFNNVKINSNKRALECIGNSVATIDENCELVTTGADATVVIIGNETQAPTLNVYGVITNKYPAGHYAVAGNGNDKSNAVINIYGKIKSDADSAIYQPNGGTINMYNGIVEGVGGIYQKAGVVNVFGGKIVGKGDNEYSYYGNGSNPIGDAITVDFCEYPAGDPVLNVNGGTFISDNKQAIGVYKPVEKKNGSGSLDIKNEALKALIERCINIKAGEFSPELAFNK